MQKRDEGPEVREHPLATEEIARKIEAQPWNRSGTDKTWVLNAMMKMLRFRDEVRRAKRVQRS